MSLTKKAQLISAEKKAAELFSEISKRQIIQAGRFENEVNSDIFDLAYEMFGIKKYWHKRIVRAGKNTLCPYAENPPNLKIQNDDIVFLDFGPIFEEWEADYGRTYVLGSDPVKLKLQSDIELAWKEGKRYYEAHPMITGAELFNYCVQLAQSYGWEFGGEIAGHIIGQFPHEKLEKEDKTLYVHPENPHPLCKPNSDGERHDWILEIHFVDRSKEIGGFFEQLLT